MLLIVGLLVTLVQEAPSKPVRGSARRYLEHNGPAAVRDCVCGGVACARFPCISKCECDGGAGRAIILSRPDAVKPVKVCGRRVGAANSRIPRTIRRLESVVQVETMMFATCINPIYLEVVVGTRVICIGPTMDFKAVR